MSSNDGRLLAPMTTALPVRSHVATSRADVVFLLLRLLAGVRAYVLLAVGLVVGVAVALAMSAAVVYVLPVVAAALALVVLAALVVGTLSARVRRWLRRHPVRTGTARFARSLGRAVAAGAVWWLLASRAAARTERAAVVRYRGRDVPIAYRPLPDSHVPTLRVVLADPATWRDLVHLVVAPLVSVAAWVALAVLAVGGVAVIGSAASSSSALGWRDPELWFTAAAGVAMLAAVPFVARGLAVTVAALGATMLATGESARMRAELDEQRLRRQLAVDAAERERRRIERDLHDGAQQRLVALGMSLGLAREKLATDPEAVAALVEEAHAEAKLALAELRDLARGIHPAILADRGLDAALSALLRRTHLPVSIVVTLPRRPPPVVESAAYFVVAEALANVTRHAAATRATVAIAEADDAVVVEVTDDGVGGADAAKGTGLAGLQERIAALGGRLTILSPAGGTTSIRAEIPCVS